MFYYFSIFFQNNKLIFYNDTQTILNIYFKILKYLKIFFKK